MATVASKEIVDGAGNYKVSSFFLLELNLNSIINCSHKVIYKGLFIKTMNNSGHLQR